MGDSSPLTSPAFVLLSWLQFFMNCSSMGLPKGSHVLAAIWLLCGLLFPWGHKSAPACASHSVTSSFEHSPASSVGSSTGCRWVSAPPWISVGSHSLGGISVLSRWSTSLPVLLHWPGSLQSCFSHIFFLFSICNHFLCYQCCWWAHTWPASWSWIA